MPNVIDAAIADRERRRPPVKPTIEPVSTPTSAEPQIIVDGQPVTKDELIAMMDTAVKQAIERQNQQRKQLLLPESSLRIETQPIHQKRLPNNKSSQTPLQNEEP